MGPPPRSTRLTPPPSRTRPSPANASSLLSSSSASQLLSGGRASPSPASRAVQPTRKAGGVVKRKPRSSRRPPPTYITADPANFRRMVQEATGFHVPASSGVRRQAAASEPSCPPPPPSASMLPTLDTSTFLSDRAAPAPARGPEDKCSSGGASLSMADTSVAKEEEEDDSWLFQELEAMTCVPDFLSDDFPSLESWGIF